MLMSAATEDCDRWLRESFLALKREAEADLVAPSSINLAPCADASSLLDAFGAGDLRQAEDILTSSIASPSCEYRTPSGLMLPVISELEREWLAGRRSYVDTVYAFWNMQRFLGDIEKRKLGYSHAPRAAWGHVLLAASPGTRHNFGLSVVDDRFRSGGWSTETFTNGNPGAIVDAARASAADFIGLSVGHDEGLADLGNFIAQLRSESRNSSVRIILGGNIFMSRKDQYDWLGADLVALNVEDALDYCARATAVDQPGN